MTMSMNDKINVYGKRFQLNKKKLTINFAKQQTLV